MIQLDARLVQAVTVAPVQHGNNYSLTDKELLITLFHIGAATRTHARAVLMMKCSIIINNYCHQYISRQCH